MSYKLFCIDVAIDFRKQHPDKVVRELKSDIIKLIQKKYYPHVTALGRKHIKSNVCEWVTVWERLSK